MAIAKCMCCGSTAPFAMQCPGCGARGGIVAMKSPAPTPKAPPAGYGGLRIGDIVMFGGSYRLRKGKVVAVEKHHALVEYGCWPFRKRRMLSGYESSPSLMDWMKLSEEVR